MSIEIHRLENGIPVLLDRMTATKKAVVEIDVPIGAAHENLSNRGVSHFLEHMFFKGTVNRSKEQISDAVADLGGSRGASTGHERTEFWIKGLGEDAPTMLDILSDM